MASKLKEYFPMIREREEVLAEIMGTEALQMKYTSWSTEEWEEFHRYPERYYHFFEQKSDTGLKLELLQKYLFIPLDIFRKNQQNKEVNERRDAWLTLFAYDEPDKVIALIEKYPEFRKIYEEGYEICRNTERVMEMFSKELYELDKNTVQYMIDEMQDTIDAQKEEISRQRDTIEMYEKTLREDCAENYKRAVNMLRNLNISDEEIVSQICAQYQISEKEAAKYL